MIDEQVLERALRAEAATYALPDGAGDAIRAEAVERDPRRRRGIWALAAAAAVVVGVVAVSGGVAPRDRFDGVAGGGAPSAVMSETSRNTTSYDKEAIPGLAGGGSSGGGANQQADPHVVRTGEMTVEVASVSDALRDLGRLARSRRGFVSASRNEGSPESPSGSVTLRVPVAEFDAAVAEAGRLGRVLDASTSGTDVSAEVTDVAARLKSLTAARAQLQSLLAKAANVGEVLAVQQRITETQTQIEQLQGRQASLADRTTFGTLTVSVYEPGAVREERTGFAKAWHDAVDGFVGAAQAVVAASGTIAFVLLALGLLTLLLRPLYRAWVRRLV